MAHGLSTYGQVRWRARGIWVIAANSKGGWQRIGDPEEVVHVVHKLGLL